MADSPNGLRILMDQGYLLSMFMFLMPGPESGLEWVGGWMDKWVDEMFELTQKS